MKIFNFLIAVFCLTNTVFGQTWVVQVGAFDQKMSLSYFAGLTGVYEERDHNDIYHYYIGGFKTEAEAKTAADNASKSGFRARAINMDESAQQCNASCREDNAGWLYFDYNQDLLRTESKRKLGIVAEVLKAHPTYKATLSGHTDAHGTDAYNLDLARRRVQAAKTYLLSLGVAESRLTTTEFGEAKPIAKNEVNGHDTPAGRQFNRRVEVAIFDEKGTKMTHLIEEAHVPATLRQ